MSSGNWLNKLITGNVVFVSFCIRFELYRPISTVLLAALRVEMGTGILCSKMWRPNTARKLILSPGSLWRYATSSLWNTAAAVSYSEALQNSNGNALIGGANILCRVKNAIFLYPRYITDWSDITVHGDVATHTDWPYDIKENRGIRKGGRGSWAPMAAW